MRIAVGGYHATKEIIPKEEYNLFLEKLSRDDSFKKLFSNENAKDTLLYYNLLGGLIKGDRRVLLKRIMGLQTLLANYKTLLQ